MTVGIQYTPSAYDLGVPLFHGLVARASRVHDVPSALIRSAVQRDLLEGTTAGLRALLGDLARGSAAQQQVYAAICNLSGDDVVTTGGAKAVDRKVRRLLDICEALDMPNTASNIRAAGAFRYGDIKRHSGWAALPTSEALPLDLPPLPPPAGAPPDLVIELVDDGRDLPAVEGLAVAKGLPGHQRAAGARRRRAVEGLGGASTSTTDRSEWTSVDRPDPAPPTSATDRADRTARTARPNSGRRGPTCL